MKKIICFVLAVVAALSMCACAELPDSDSLTGTVSATGLVNKEDGYTVTNTGDGFNVTINEWSKFSSAKMWGLCTYNETSMSMDTDGSAMYHEYMYTDEIDIDLQNVDGELIIYCEDVCISEDMDTGISKTFTMGYEPDSVIDNKTDTMTFFVPIGDGVTGNIDMIRGTWND